MRFLRRSVISICAQNLAMRLFWIAKVSFGIFSAKVFGEFAVLWL